MENNTGVWIRILLPEDLHTGLKIAAAQEKLPNGKHKTLQQKVIECIQTGFNSNKSKK